MEWQPIETAPKDGTRILLWDGEMFWVGAWYQGLSNEDLDWFLSADLDGKYPALTRTDCYWYLDPTHWQPLPEPPVNP